ncbi:MAG: metal ABC transporter permease [Desulfovibrio sp.]|nr:metal ABC transporter permease [Desulfovibrio sp.]
MPDFAPLYALLGCLPFDCLQLRFMQQALLALLLLAPLAAILGVHVVNCRMAFFSDAIGHSAFAGVALGLLTGFSPLWSMPLFGLAAGLAIMAVQQKARLAADTAIGIVFSAVVALGLVIVSRAGGANRDVQGFLYGDILTISQGEIGCLALLLILGIVFQFFAYNRLFLLAVNPVMARAHGIRGALWQYLFAGLLSLVVMFAVRGVGVLLVTALLIVPAATARNLAASAGSMFWWALLVGLVSAVVGLLLSAQPWLATSSGATIILTSCLCFALSCLWGSLRASRKML